MKDKLISSKLGHISIFIILAISGNVQLREFDLLYLVLALLIPIFFHLKIPRGFFKKLRLVIVFLTSLFILQLFILGSANLLGILNMYAKIFIAGFVIYINREQFIIRFLNVMFFISIVSLIFFSVDVLLNGMYKYIPAPIVIDSKNFYFFYYSVTNPWLGMIRNPGIFWEPGVFSNYLVLSLAFTFPVLAILTKAQKYKLLIVFITLLTTQSTTGYIVAFVVFLSSYLLKNKLKLIHIASFLIFIFMFIIVYNNSVFLKSKLEKQIVRSIDNNGEYSTDRLGTLLFDFYYIKKHPIIGNGLQLKTRYADHPNQILNADKSAGGNGFSEFIVSYGLPFSIFFFYLIYSRINVIYNHRLFSLLFVLIIILNLQGEPLMTYPFYWGLIFINGKHIFPKDHNNTYMISETQNIKRNESIIKT